MTRTNEILQEKLERLSGRAKTRKELASEYGVSPRTLRRWLKARGFNNLSTYKIPPADLIKIYKVFGLPTKNRRSWW